MIELIRNQLILFFQGTDIEDVAAGVLCGACVNCQIARELRDNNEEQAAENWEGKTPQSTAVVAEAV